MTEDRLTERMQEVLDGTASPADTAALHAVLARDADAAEEFAAWSAMFEGLSALPMAHAPEGLVAAIGAALPAAPMRVDARPEKIFAASDQLLSDASVLGSGRTRTTRRPFGFKTMSSWLMPASSKESGYMNTQQKVLAGGAAAIVALGLAAVLNGYPPKSGDVVGTVVPAERYRAPQTGAEAVKLGEQSATTSTATGIDAGTPAAANLEADRAVFRAEADRISKLSEADRMAYLSQLDKVSKLSEADRAMYLSQAEKSGKLTQADRVAFQSQAEKMGKLSEADRIAYLSQMDKVSKLSEADRAAFMSQADQRAAFKIAADQRAAYESQADLRAAYASQADLRAAFASQADLRAAWATQAEKISKLSEADRAAYLSQLDKVSKLSGAERAASMTQAQKARNMSEADRAAFASQAEKISKLSEADRAAYLSQLDKVSKLSVADRQAFLQAERAASLSQADRAAQQSQADRAANRQEQADKAANRARN